jgi:hypothetical protein
MTSCKYMFDFIFLFFKLFISFVESKFTSNPKRHDVLLGLYGSEMKTG